MPVLEVHVKHSAKVYDVQLNTDLAPSAFKDNVYQVTGVPPERMKVMVKGGVLKDDSSWKKIGPKAGQTFMVIGAAGELPKPPEKPVVFLEDMDDADLAQTLSLPVGLKNLGNTCYMNSTVQALRAIPELQAAMQAPANSTPSPLVRQLRDLYVGMGKTTEPVIPYSFLQVLRTVNPQFAEMDRREKSMGSMAGYAQQDAEECLGQIISTLRDVPGLPGPSGSNPGNKKFIEQYMMGCMRRELKCDEAPDEPSSVTTEDVLKIECNITISTNYMMTGILETLNQKVEKNSPSLGRQAVYTQESRLTRLPEYLEVQMVRFAWRADINKKAKIMRKVKFPTELDGTDLCTKDAQAKLQPASRKLKDILSARADRRKIRKRMKNLSSSAAGSSTAPANNSESTETNGETSEAAASGPSAGDLPDEVEQRKKEKEEFEALVDQSVKDDIGASHSGLYELVAIVTHKGAAADAGHYMAFVKKSVFHGQSAAAASATSGGADEMQVDSEDAETLAKKQALDDAAEADEDWYKFDDDKVSIFPKEKLASLDGGGEDSSAYVLLYKTRSL